MFQIQIKNREAQFSQKKFNQKESLRHTFHQQGQNEYLFIPIFQKNDKIQFRYRFYQIIKLQRRTETFLQYRIQDLDTHQLLTIEYQFNFDDKSNEENYYYYEDQTKCFHPESQNYRKCCRIALKKVLEQDNLIKLTRFIHLNNLNQNAKIKLLHIFANNEQLEKLDYNQIYIDDKQQIKMQKGKQNQSPCFIQAPIAISPIINFQQTFLIGFYYAIINNLVIFNQYLNRENDIKQALQNGFINQLIQLQQQIKGTINYQYKLQIPKGFLQQGIKRIFDQQQLLEFNFLFQLIEIIGIILRIQQIRLNQQNLTTQIEEGNNQQEDINTEHQQKQEESSSDIDTSYKNESFRFILKYYQTEIVYIQHQFNDVRLLFIQQLNYLNQICDTIKNPRQSNILGQQQQTFIEANILMKKLNGLDMKINDLLKHIKEIFKQMNLQASLISSSNNLSVNIQKENDTQNNAHRIVILYFGLPESLYTEKEPTQITCSGLLNESSSTGKQISYQRNKIQIENVVSTNYFARIDEDYHIEMLYEYEQLFNTLEGLMHIQIRTDIQIDLIGLREFKLEINIYNNDNYHQCSEKNSLEEKDEKNQGKTKIQNKIHKNKQTGSSQPNNTENYQLKKQNKP